MNCKTTNVIGVSFKMGNLFKSIVVEYTNLRIISTSNDPIFTSNKLCSTNYIRTNDQYSSAVCCLCLSVPGVSETSMVLTKAYLIMYK